MNKLFLTSTSFSTNRLFPQTASPKRYISLVLFTCFLIGAILFLLPKTVLLQQQNKTLRGQAKTMEESLKTAQAENRSLIEKAEKERKNLKETIENYKRENESLQFDLTKTKNSLSSLTEEKSYLEEMLVNKSKEIESIKNRSVPAAAVNITGDLAQKLKEKDEEIQNLNEQSKVLSQRLDRLYKTTNDKMSEINVAKIALEDTISDSRKTIENEWDTVDLGKIQVGKTGAAGSSTEKKETTRETSKKQGRILAVNEEHGFVVVDLGKVDGIRNDSVLTLKKNNEVIATLTVLEARDVMTACNIKDLSQGKKIEINDPVLIRK